ncbi:MAG: DUF4350 domain-containing protein [Promethearchaeota archaeon]
MRINKKTIFLVISLTMMLSPIFIIPPVYSAEIKEIDAPKSSQMLSNPIRVAIYDDANITKPFYATSAVLINNYSNIQTTLLAAGYEVTTLTTNQIFNHELMNARYDVFIMADNLPKANITNYVLEYWLGGGALLSMDSAVNFICYYGIMPPESAGDDGNGLYWIYQISTDQNITTRYPVSRSYAVNDTFTISGSQSSATFSWSALQGTSIASELTKIATRPGLPDAATVVAFDPQSRGGKVVHLPSPREIEDDAILIDAIEWLCPRPKARILFDLSHYPFYGIDLWDSSTYANYTPRYTTMRDDLVSRSYMVDKFYLGNYTTANLALYDLLIIVLPSVNFTTSEVNDVQNWISDGGSLLILGDNHGLSTQLNNINELLNGYDLAMNSTDDGATLLDYNEEHPTVEDCTQLTMINPGLVVVEGSASPIWGNDVNHITIASQEVGEGRIILASDINFVQDSNIGMDDNEQYMINMINWLAASKAEVLIFVTDYNSPNYYKTPLSNALNELGIDFYLTSDDYYMNLSMYMYDWELLVIDLPVGVIDVPTLTVVNDYVKNGGKLIMSTYRVDSNPTHPLWSRLGFAYKQEQPDKSSLYIWDSSHAIFNTPVDYGEVRFDPFFDYFDEGDLLRVYQNATSLAGYTVSETENNTNLVLGNGGKTLFNGYLIDQFTGDLDDSTYADNFELWVNEIAYILKPKAFSLSSDADAPDDDGMFNITWTVSSEATEYNIYQHSSFITELTGAETLIGGGVTTNSHPLTGLTNGTYYYIIESTNDYGNTLSNCIEVKVEIPPSPPNPGPPPGGIPGYELISLISTMLIIMGVLTLALKKKNMLRK